ncbi:MAG: hypothetical protein ABSG18_18650 [Steroidobacteraceae bacterium]
MAAILGDYLKGTVTQVAVRRGYRQVREIPADNCFFLCTSSHRRIDVISHGREIFPAGAGIGGRFFLYGMETVQIVRLESPITPAWALSIVGGRLLRSAHAASCTMFLRAPALRMMSLRASSDPRAVAASDTVWPLLPIATDGAPRPGSALLSKAKERTFGMMILKSTCAVAAAVWRAAAVCICESASANIGAANIAAASIATPVNLNDAGHLMIGFLQMHRTVDRGSRGPGGRTTEDIGRNSAD